VQSTLRPLLPNSDTTGVLPILNTSSMVVRGTGRYVVQILEILEKADAEAERNLAPGHMGPVDTRESKTLR
jgi:hypothetical protein